MLNPVKQEAGVAICDALLDYYLPNQVQRERAHRDLMARDGIKESRLGLFKYKPTTQNDPVVAAAVTAGGGRSPTGGDNGSGERSEGSTSNGGGGISGNGREEQDGEGRDVDDDVSFKGKDVRALVHREFAKSFCPPHLLRERRLNIDSFLLPCENTCRCS